MKKRLLALILTCVTMLALLTSTANAAVLTGFKSKVDYDNTDPARYTIEVDLVNQIITVYEGGGVVLQSLCTTGGKDTPTGSGKFKIGDLKERFGYFVAYGEYAQYWTQVVRGVYIHSVMYKSQKLSSMSKSAYNNLGKNVSHGCIRVLPHVAQWIYYNCPPGTLCNITKNKAADPALVKSLKSQIPAYDKYQQPTDAKGTPPEVAGCIKLDNVPVRTGFSNSKDKTVTTLHYGDKIELLQLGEEWCKVRTSAGKLGYVKTAYIMAYPDDIRTASAYVATEKTYIYEKESRKSDTLTSIPKGAKVDVTAQAGEGWMMGSYKGKSGYVRTKYVKLGEGLLYPNPDGTWQDGSAPSAAPAPSAANPAPVQTSGARIKDGVVVNFRSGPGTGYPVLAELSAGTSVKVLSVADTWYLCEVQGIQGYLHPSCLAGF